jgi:sortase A
VRTVIRATAAILAFAGTAALAWVALTLYWGEPFTAIAAARAQTALRSELAHREAAWTPAARAKRPPPLRRRAAAYHRSLRRGDAIGRIAVPRLGLRTVFVEGTRRGDLARGPGHYRMTTLPGLGGTIAIAGHRTTYLRPFRHIDKLRIGDSIYLELPYGTFRYRVYARRIVDDRDWSIIRRRRFEKLVLSACHPLYSAARRIVVLARLKSASASRGR